MLRSTSDLEDYAIHAIDGPIGHVKDFYFDDEAWVIRYLVVETGTWLSSRKVLISPIAIGNPNWTEKALPVSITKEQVKNSPDIDTGMPVSRQHETQYLGYYHYPFYWHGEQILIGGSYPNRIPGYAGAEEAYARVDAAWRQDDDPHLRSCKAVMSHNIHATDGDIGHVQGLLVDEETWAIRYMIVNTSNWWLGHQVLIAPQWIKDVSWSDATVSVNQTRQAVKDALSYDPSAT